MEILDRHSYNPRSPARLVLAAAGTCGLAWLGTLTPEAWPALTLLAALLLKSLIWPALRGAKALTCVTHKTLLYRHRPDARSPEDFRHLALSQIFRIRVDDRAGLVQITDRIGDDMRLQRRAFPAAATLRDWLEHSSIRLEFGPLA